MLGAQTALIDSLKRTAASLPGDSNKVNVLLKICNLSYYQNPDSTIAYGKRAIELSQKIGFEKGLASAHVQLGTALNSKWRFSEALAELREAEKICIRQNYSYGLASAYGNMATNFNMQGQLDSAVKYALLSTRSFEKSKAKTNLAVSYGNLGVLYSNLKNYSKALEYLRLNYSLSKKLGDANSIVSSLNNIAKVLFEMDREEDALPLLKEATELAQKNNNLAGLSVANNQLGTYYNNLNNFQKAREYYLQSLEISEKIDDQEGITMALCAIGNSWVDEKNADKALEYLNKSFQLAKENGMKEELRESYRGLANVWKMKGNPTKALEYFEKYSNLKDSMLKAEMTGQVNELAVRYETLKKEDQIKLLGREAELAKAVRAKKESEFNTLFNSAIAALIVIIVLIGGTVLVLRNRRMAEKLRIEKEMNELEHEALRLQMNPHFIFNSLSSINNFIGKNETSEAKRYLAKFSKLMRLILDNSREAFIPLKNEIDSVVHYMELEQLRFGGKFTFGLNIDEHIDQDQILIPPMLLQPYVENSILHGLAPKNADGKILLSFKKQTGTLLCEIEDNGVGRKKSAELRKQTQQQHRSIGMGVTKERLQMLYSEADLRITDVVDEQGEVAGTKVSFTIPYREKV